VKRLEQGIENGDREERIYFEEQELEKNSVQQHVKEKEKLCKGTLALLRCKNELSSCVADRFKVAHTWPSPRAIAAHLLPS